MNVREQTPSLAFVACIERGALEAQALMLFESIRAFAGAYAECPIYAFAPRPGLGVGQDTRVRLDQLRVQYIDEPLNTECPAYGSVNRLVAGRYAEATTTHDLLVVLDSDTLVLREPSAFALDPETDAAVRPVDAKGMCSEGPGDPNDGYWQELCRACGVAYDDLPWIRSYVDDVRVKASYNGGLVVVRRDRGLLHRCVEVFFTSLRHGLSPRDQSPTFRASTGWVAPAASRLWGSSQSALSLALWSSSKRIVTLPPTYNYPLHAHRALGERGIRDFKQLVLAHYHWLFQPDALADNPLYTASPETGLAPDKLAWLWARTPLPATVQAASRSDATGTSAKQVRGAEARPVVVIGMHRSGTSLTASILRSAGVHMGDRLNPGGRGNSEGHFEDLDFVSFHSDILGTMGLHPDGWDAVQLDALPDFAVDRAQALIDARKSRPLWGWKDPRTTLFLPFWERALPEARFLFVYRNPWEVIDSLYCRGDVHFRRDPPAAARIWSHYNRIILDAVARLGRRALLVKLDDVAAHPASFVEQVARAFGLPLTTAASPFKPELLRRRDEIGDWPTLANLVLRDQVALFERLDQVAHRFEGALPVVPTDQGGGSPADALLREWAALRATQWPTLGSEATARLQVFSPVGGQYSEANSWVQPLIADGQRRHYTFTLPCDGSGPLRFDVGDSVGFVELRALSLRTKPSGLSLGWSGPSLDQAPLRLLNAIRVHRERPETFCFVTLNNDPQLYLELPEPRFQGDCQVDIDVGFRTLLEPSSRDPVAGAVQEVAMNAEGRRRDLDQALARRRTSPDKVDSADLGCLAGTRFFDEAFYLDANPDVRQARIDPRLHYLCSGAAEGRDPSPTFSTVRYLETHPEISGSSVNPLVHFIRTMAERTLT